MAWLCLLVVGSIGSLAACSIDGPASSAPSVTPGEPTEPATSAPSSPIALQHFADDMIAFDFPAGWHKRVGEINPSGNFPIVFVASSSVPSECTTTAAGGEECRTWPVTHLAPGRAVVAWRFVGLPGDSPPTGGTPLDVDGLSAFRTIGPADSGCAAIGGDESIDVTVPAIPGAYYWYAADACLSGPERAGNEASFSAIIASTAFPAMVSPSP